MNIYEVLKAVGFGNMRPGCPSPKSTRMAYRLLRHEHV